jgi:hypothetical protein
VDVLSFPPVFPNMVIWDTVHPYVYQIHQPQLILTHHLIAVPELYLLLGKSGCFANDKQAEKDAFIQGKSMETGVSFF